MTIYRVRLSAFDEEGLGLIEADSMSEAVAYAMAQAELEIEVEELTKAEAEAEVAAFVAAQVPAEGRIMGPTI